MTKEWIYQTSSLLVDDGYYYKDKIIFINLDKYKELEVKYSAKIDGVYTTALLFPISIPRKRMLNGDIVSPQTRTLLINTDRSIFINNIDKIDTDLEDSINKSIIEVEEWVKYIDSKISQIFSAKQYVKYIADLLRTNKLLIAKTTVNKYEDEYYI